MTLLTNTLACSNTILPNVVVYHRKVYHTIITTLANTLAYYIMLLTNTLVSCNTILPNVVAYFIRVFMTHALAYYKRVLTKCHTNLQPWQTL